jgi:hypothetical protein
LLGAPLWAGQEPSVAIRKSGEQLFVLVGNVDKSVDQQLEDLLLSLINSDSLAVQRSPVDQPDPTAFVRARGLLSGGTIGPKLASLLCDLNPQHCSRERLIILSKEDDAPTEHVLYTRPSTTKWVWSTAKELLIPAIAARSKSTWISFDVKPKLPLSKLVVDILQGCEVFDERCKREIEKFNALVGERVFDEGYSGPISLPARQLELRTDVTKTEATWEPGPDDIASTFVKLYELPKAPSGDGPIIYKTLFPLTEQKLIIDLRTIYDRVGAGPIYTSVDNDLKHLRKEEVLEGISENGDTRQLAADELKQSQSFQANKTLEKSLVHGLQRVPFGAAGPSQGIITPKQIEDHQARLIKMLSFPYGQLADFPAPLRLKIVLAVLDYWFDGEHCAFVGANVDIRNKQTNHPLQAQANGACDSWHATNQVDHGTHVLGLISGRAPGDRAWGLNPYAEVHAIEVEEPLSQADKIQNLKQEVIDLILERQPRIINMSWGGYAPGSTGVDPLEEAVSLARNANILVVAAAGNDSRNLSIVCDVRPACYDLPNVIAVAALDGGDRPALLNGTNYGSRVHIAAPGEGIFSAVSRGSFGTMSGSSQAAALVTGTASLLMAANRNLTAIKVRNRLIYCSQLLWGEDLGRLVGGRLDVACTLAGAAGWLKRDSQPVLGATLRTNQSIKFRSSSDAELTISLSQIRGIQQDTEHGEFSVFTNASIGDPNSEISRTDGLVLEGDAQELKAAVPGGQIKVRVADIVHYAAPW